MTLQNRNEIIQSSSVAGAFHTQAIGIGGAGLRLADRAVCTIRGITVTYEPQTGLPAFAPPRYFEIVRPVGHHIIKLLQVFP